MINGSAMKIEKDIQEVKKYSPPPKKNKVEKPKTSKQIIQKKEEPLKLEEEPLKLEETLNLDEQEPLVLNETVEKNEIKEELEIKNLSPRISPAARKMATESKVNLQNIQGSGKDGIILKEDILSLMNYKPAPSERKIKHGPEERIKMTRLRATIAKRLKEAQENAAMLTTFNEVDMSEVISMRTQYKEEFRKNYGVKLGFMSFFKKACVIGLKNFPSVNAEIRERKLYIKIIITLVLL